jgi:phospholipase/lecithinase/hemolysin
MRFTSRLRFTVAVAFLTFGFASSAALATPFSGIYVFGDSLSDAGNVYAATGGSEPVSPPYSNGRFTNGNVWAQDLAKSLGVGPVTPSLTGGNDFAFGGAETGTTPAHAGSLLDLPAQLTAYNAAVSTPQPGALYALWIGSNDVNSLASALLDGSLSPADINADVAQAIGNVGTAVDGLAADGLENLLAVNVPDLSKTPDAVAAANQTPNPADTLAEIQALSGLFDTALGQKLTMLSQTDGFNLSLVDSFSLLDQVVADPAGFGLTDVTDPCWTGNFTDSQSGSVCSTPDNHLFWDGLHPTAAGHRLLADAALKALPATAVPEPGSGGLFLIGLIGIALLIARRRIGGDRRTGL